MKRYIAALATMAFGILCAVLGVNLLVDSNRVFAPIGLDRFDARRHMTSRTGIGELLHQSDSEVLLLGSSRILYGVDSGHPGFGGRRVVNTGMKAGNIYESSHALRVGLAENDFKEAILFPDFWSFDARYGGMQDFELSRLNPKFNAVDYYLEKLLSVRSLYVSYTVAKSKPGEVAAKSSKRRGVERHEAYERVLNDFLTGFFSNYNYSESRLDLFEDMVAASLEAEIETRVVIVPVHAALLEAIRAAGLWATFETWKRDIVDRVGAAHHRVAGAPLPPVWDFTQYNQYTTEAIPPGSETENHQRWFRDPSHMTRELGNRMLDQVFGIAEHQEMSGSTYGSLLERATLDRHLEDIRQGRTRYVEAHPEDAAWVSRVADALGFHDQP